MNNVDLFSNRCPPCAVLAPTISLLAERYARSVTVCEVDVDRVGTVAEKYGVTAIPTVLIIRNGKKVNRLVGLQSEIDYITLLDKLTAFGGTFLATLPIFAIITNSPRVL